jgi:hypothetical protein
MFFRWDQKRAERLAHERIQKARDDIEPFRQELAARASAERKASA